MKNLERLFAEKLLKIKAIKLQPANPFTWASGWKSPFYCDNRKTLSYPSLRSFVKFEITRLVLERFGQVDAIAGVAASVSFSAGLLVQAVMDNAIAAAKAADTNLFLILFPPYKTQYICFCVFIITKHPASWIRGIFGKRYIIFLRCLSFSVFFQVYP